MFPTQIQTRRQSALAAKKTVSDENVRLPAKTGVAAVKAVAAQPATKKRPVLGDVSNVVAAAPTTHHATGKAVAAPKTVKVTATTTTVAPVRPRTRSSSSQEVPAKKADAPAVQKAVRASTTTTAAAAAEATKKVTRKPAAPGTKATTARAGPVTRKPVPSATTTAVAAVARAPAATGSKAAHAAPSAAEVAPVLKRVKTQEWDDLDAEDVEDPTMLSEYVVEIYEYLREQELATLPKPNYMDDQTEIQWKMRSILVDWLVEVHSKFRLLPETLYLTVNIIDRFLSYRVVALAKLQLVGVTAMFIAAKYEEVVAPSIQNFLYMADGGYDVEEILKAERYILQILDFGLSYPNPVTFLRRCSKADKYDLQTRTLAKYLMEVSLIDHRFLSMPPSMISASGLYLSRKMLGRGPWTPNLVHYSGYTPAQLAPCVQKILEYLQKPLKYEALYKKYTSRKFMKASIFVKEWMARQQFTFAAAADSEDEEEQCVDEEEVDDDDDEQAEAEAAARYEAQAAAHAESDCETSSSDDF